MPKSSPMPQETPNDKATAEGGHGPVLEAVDVLPGPPHHGDVDRPPGPVQLHEQTDGDGGHLIPVAAEGAAALPLDGSDDFQLEAAQPDALPERILVGEEDVDDGGADH